MSVLYPTVDFASVLRKACGKAGIPYAQIQADDFDLFTGYFDDRLKECWEVHRWPDFCPIEQRTFAEAWNSTDTIAALEVRYDAPSQQYYISLQANNVNQPPTFPPAFSGAALTVNFAWWQVCQPQYSGQNWTPNTAYPLGTIVLNPADWQYYSCFQAGTSGATTLDLAMFALLTPLDRVIAKTQSWPALSSPPGTTGPATVIGDFIFPAYDRDPRETTKVRCLPFTLSQDGAQFTEFHHTPAWVWLEFRLPRPELSGSLFDATVSYPAGRGMYYTSATTTPGDFYVATVTTNAGDTPDSAPESWTLQAIPKQFELALVRGAFADWLRADGQLTAANGAESDMLAALELEADKLQRQSGQVRRMQMR